MKKTYLSPKADAVLLETEDILTLSVSTDSPLPGDDDIIIDFEN